MPKRHVYSIPRPFVEYTGWFLGDDKLLWCEVSGDAMWVKRERMCKTLTYELKFKS